MSLSRRASKKNSTKSRKASSPGAKPCKEFWNKFIVDLDRADDEMLSYKAGIPTGKKCEKCGQGELLERISRHGFFLGCSRYPECDFIQDLSPEIASGDGNGENKIEYCDNCGKEMALKRGRFGMFLACTGYPDCKTTRRLVEGTRIAHAPDEPLEEKCTLCGNNLVKKHGRFGAIHRLLRLSEMQIHAADHPGHQMSEVPRRRIRPPRHRARPWTRAHLLRLQPLSRLRFHHAARAHQRALPEMRRAVHRREAHQARQLPRVPQGRLRLGS